MLKHRKQAKALPWRKPQKTSNTKKAVGLGLGGIVLAAVAGLFKKKDFDR